MRPPGAVSPTWVKVWEFGKFEIPLAAKSRGPNSYTLACHIIRILVIFLYILVDFIILILLSNFSITKLSIFPLDVALVTHQNLILTIWELVSEVA